MGICQIRKNAIIQNMSHHFFVNTKIIPFCVDRGEEISFLNNSLLWSSLLDMEPFLSHEFVLADSNTDSISTVSNPQKVLSSFSVLKPFSGTKQITVTGLSG